MDHGPAVKLGKDNAAGYKQKLGLIMFLFYAIIYAGFVIINTVKPVIMEKIIFAGLDLALVYGIGLILLAIVSGLIYNALCTAKENQLNKDEGDQK